MPYTIPAITTPNLSRWKSHTAISEWQIHTQEHSWDRTTTILRSFAGVSADSTVAAGTAARTHCLGCCCCCCYFHSSVTYGPTLFIFIPLTGAADAASAVAVAAVGKITCACRHRRCDVGSSRWNINHAALRPRVLRVGTTLPAIARTFTPCIQAISSRSGVFVVVETATKIILEHKKFKSFLYSPPFCVVYRASWCLPTIFCAFTCFLRSAHARTRTGVHCHAGPLCTRTLRFRIRHLHLHLHRGQLSSLPPPVLSCR